MRGYLLNNKLTDQYWTGYILDFLLWLFLEWISLAKESVSLSEKGGVTVIIKWSLFNKLVKFFTYAGDPNHRYYLIDLCAIQKCSAKICQTETAKYDVQKPICCARTVVEHS